MDSQPGSDIHILYIDDDPLLTRTIGTYLRQRGFSVSTANDGSTGISLFNSRTPDLVLCDLKMPGMDGFQVMSEVRRVDEDVPIIVVSGAQGIDDAVSALRLGAWDFVTKPIPDMAMLDHSIDTALERARLIKENELHRLHLEEEVAVQTKALRAEIDERERAELRLKDMLNERELLLKEINHRVKNNLQLVSSLLSLKSRYSTSEEARSVLDDSRNRIRSMLIAHELLLNSAELSRIDAPHYFRGILNHLAGGGFGRKEIQFRIETDQMPIPITVAIPCGLITTELVTNALKHAFPERDHGSVEFLARKNDDRLVIEIGDDGVGFASEKMLKQARTLGIQIVNRLVSQLRGSIDVKSAPDSGTRFVIEVPLN